MNGKDDLIAKIIEIEWNMFQKTNVVGGRASCQEDPKTFQIMRFSQFMSWSEAALENYLDDLIEAEKKGMNLISEKYARIMKSTSPPEYAKIAHLLSALDLEALQLIDKIVKIVLKWEEELSKKYPSILQRGRPIYSSEDTPFATSLETYLHGELATYSKNTLELYYQHLLNEKSQNINGSEIILETTVKQYGYKSLGEANEKLSS